MGGKGSGRLNKTNSMLREMRGKPELKTSIISPDMFMPNHSGVSSHPEFKKAVDDISLSDLSDTTITSVTKNDHLIYNGDAWVNAPDGTTFTFSIASFSDGQSSTQLAGSGLWKAAGAITFTASYNNGPLSETAFVSSSGWSNLDMTNDGEGPTVSTELKNYPSIGGSISFTLNATDGNDPDTAGQGVSFYNLLNYGITTKTDTYLESDIEGLANQELTNDNTQVWDSVTAGSGEYLLFAFPTRLGIPVFYVGGFEGGFEDPETVSVTNSAGATEDYYVWRSNNANLGATVVETRAT